MLLSIVVFLTLWSLAANHARDRVSDLEHIPIQTRVHLVGRVTYVDAPGHRIWVQDETGALSLQVASSYLELRPGTTVSIYGIKASHFDSAQGFQSVHLTNLRIEPSSQSITLPKPNVVALRQFPSEDKNGIQIQVEGVLDHVTINRRGQVEFELATATNVASAVVPGTAEDYKDLLNSDVRLLGVPEETTDPNSKLPLHRLWVAEAKDIARVHSSGEVPSFTVRTLYSSSQVRSGHLVRVSGKLVSRNGHEIVLEDQWGTLDCVLDDSTNLHIGSVLQVVGYPRVDGLRISLTHASGNVIEPNPAQVEASQISERYLTTIRAVHQLSAAEAATALPVRIQGTLTYVDPIWRQLYIQDQTDGIYVKYSGRPPISTGMRVTLTGLSNAGDFAPTIIAPKIQITGTASLPAAQAADSIRASAGLLDSQLVSLEGIVRAVKTAENPDHPIITFDLYSPVGPVHVYTSPLFGTNTGTEILEDARIRTEGVFGTVFNNRRQIIGYQLLVGEPRQVMTLERPEPRPFDMIPTPIGALLQFRPGQRPGHRVKIEGIVTQVGRDHLYLQDATSGVEVRAESRSIQVGDSVVAVGYPTATGGYSPVLTNAILKRLGPDHPIEPKHTTAEGVLNGQDDSKLVALEGRLIAQLAAPGREILLLASGPRTFAAQLDSSDASSALRAIRPDSIVRVSGVCVSQVDPDRLYTLLTHQPTSFALLLRSPNDVTVIRNASFWTIETLRLALFAVSLIVPTILIWVWFLRRRVLAQAAAIAKAQETAQAVRDLSDSMSTIAREQHFEAEVSVRGSEEIAGLVVGFNRMIGELRRREDAKKAAEAKLHQMAMIDELTGLPNRRMLFEAMSQSIARARREKTRLGLLYIDLDGFKTVNDTLGHDFGDALLVQVAQRLRSRTRASDVLARIGGDEFTLLLESVKHPEDALTAAQAILESLVSPISANGNTIRVGASVGISFFPDHANESGQLLQQADCAMYAAKRNGKNQIVQFGDDLGNAAHERITIETELRRAIAGQSITVHYQPEFDLSTGRVVRFEALARWFHPTLGQVSPLRFIPIAEETGTIMALGEHILLQACRDAVEWNRASDREIAVAVNVSSIQFAHDSFVAEIEEVLSETGLPAHLLQLELTESAALSRVERSIEVMSRLKKLGVSLAIDDFGTGYSCLSYLPRLHFDAIKIDRSFVSELIANPDSAVFVQSILSMAHNLEMRVIIEGIETAAELQAIMTLGADEAQGFYLGRPAADGFAYLSEDPSPRFDF